MATKVLQKKFDFVNKQSLKIPVNHTRTGACTSKNGVCTHGSRKTK